MNWKRYIPFAFTLPNDLLGLLWLCAVRVLWGKEWKWSDGAFIVVLDPLSWPSRTWYKVWGGTTFSHCIMINGADNDLPRILFHERVHVEQFEATALAGFVLALGLISSHAWLQGLLVWLTLPWWIYGAAMLTAVFRGKDAYRHNFLEEDAYDATDEHGPS